MIRCLDTNQALFLFSFHKQVVHGDMALDVVGIASGLDAIGGDHRQVDGLLGARLTLES